MKMLKKLLMLGLFLIFVLPVLGESGLPETVYNQNLPSLRDLFRDYFDFGTAISREELMAVREARGLPYQFSILTAGNEMKPASLLDLQECRKLAQTDETAVAVRFSSAKPILDFAKGQGLRVHGHVLVWHSQTPLEFFKQGYIATRDFVSREVMLSRMENYIREVLTWTAENYPGVIVSWDVVNEAVADGKKGLRESNWTRVVGEDFVLKAFEYARKYAAEGTLLYYNDYNTPYEPKLTVICDLLDQLKAEGTVDGYGFQCHFSVNTPPIAAVKRAFARVAEKGLRLRVSELDVGISTATDARLREQALVYTDLFRIFLDYADQLEAVQVWGITDSRSWRSTEFPLLFSSGGYPKPAYYALVELAEAQ